MFTCTRFQMAESNSSMVITVKPNVTEKNCTLFQHLTQLITSRSAIRASVDPTSQFSARHVYEWLQGKKHKNGAFSNAIMLIPTFTTISFPVQRLTEEYTQTAWWSENPHIYIYNFFFLFVERTEAKTDRQKHLICLLKTMNSWTWRVALLLSHCINVLK
jgi:hypothetical protein